jgi:pimeloyl-ACP methyl ester carboxylesterase
MTRWILLRGLTREAGHWGGFPTLLRERTGDAVACIDLPGCGVRWRDRSPASVEGIARDVLARLPQGPCTLLALSLGAMVAMACSRAAPDRITGCVLVNTSAAGGARLHERLQPANWPTVVRFALPGLTPLQREARVLAMTSARPQANRHVLSEWARIAASRPVRRANAVRQLWAAARFRSGAAPAVPILLLASRGDALVSPDCSRRLAQEWAVPLREHPWAGHDLPLDDPGWVVDQAATWQRGLAR